MSGYSSKPLHEKLGIKSGHKLIFLNAPENYFSILGDLPENIQIAKKLTGDFDVIQFFVTEEKTYQLELQNLKQNIKQNGMIWISWPKGKSKISTDLNENKIRDFALKSGLVDVKVCAVDDDWSGLKLVIPVKDRK